MPFEPLPGSGALFKNDKQGNEKRPDATGYVIAHRDIKSGEKLNLAAWTKESARGKFQSVRMSDIRGASESEQDSATRQDSAPNVPNSDDLDDSIPF